MLAKAAAVVPADVARWLRAARQGDVAAFEQLYRHFVGRIYGLCLRMTGNVSDAEDCTQEAFINAWRKLDTYRGEAQFGTWLQRIAINQVLGRRRRHLQLASAESDGVSPPAEGLVDIEAGIGRLTERPRHVFVLRAVYGYSERETAEFLGIAVGTVKAHYHQARKALQQELKV